MPCKRNLRPLGSRRARTSLPLRRLILYVLAALAARSAQAGNYVQQSTFAIPVSSISGMGRDSVGNLYVLGLPAGATTYSVSSFRTPAMEPVFSFDTGLSSPAAFGVNGSGEVSVLNWDSQGIRLVRFTNVGTPVGQAVYRPNPNFGSYVPMSMAIDADNGRVYLGFSQLVSRYCVQQVGVNCTPYVKGWVEQYDMQGTYLAAMVLPGTSASGGCYTPSKLAAVPDGGLNVADSACQHLLKFGLNGSLIGDTAASAFTYSLNPRAMWTDSESNLYISQTLCELGSCPLGVLKVSPSASPSAAFAVDAIAGQAWDGRILYLSSSSASPVRRYVYDGAPTVPVQTGPLGTVVQHSSCAALSWQSSNDPDGDPITYSVYLGTDPARLSLAGAAADSSFSSRPLGFGTTYFWQVAATDSYLGLPVQTTLSPVVNFNLNLTNSPPGAFAVLGGTGTVSTRSTSVALAWGAAVDPDGDPVTYNLYWRPAGQSTPAVIVTTGTAQVMTGLAFAATYYWSVRAFDVYGASTLMAGPAEQAYYPVFKNSPPATPYYLSAASSYSLHTASPAVALSWAPSADPDGDPVSYQLEVRTSTGSWPVVSLGTSTSITLSTIFETTYTWRVTAYDPYAASLGPWQSFVVHLANQAPSPILYTSTGSITTRATSYSLTWQDTGDPDGDPYSYALYLGTTPAALALAQQGTQTAYSLTFQFGTTYYWQVAATDSFGARTTGAIQAFLPIFRNSPPPAPAVLAGTGSSTQHTFTPQASLSWSTVTDPDGDPIGYRLLLGTSPGALAAVQDGSGTSYALPSPMLGTTYYWQVAAYDPYDGAGTTVIQSLCISLDNQPPSAFGVITGNGTVSTRNTSQLLSWQSAIDPDGDTITYELDLSTVPTALLSVQQSTATSFNLAFQLGTTYYWQVTARDGFGGATSSGLQTFLPVFQNSAPTVPQNQSRTGSISYHGYAPSQAFFWQSSTDPDGDPLTYSLSYGTDPVHMAFISPATLGLTLPVPLNTAFYYSIVATDIYGAASPSPTNWVYYQFTNSPPQPFDIAGGTGTAFTRDATSRISWNASTDPDGDPLTYRVFLGTDPVGLSRLADTAQTWANLSDLAFGVTYYWRVDAFDGFGATTTVNGGAQPLLYVFKNSPPAMPAAVSGNGALSLHTLSPAAMLSWTAVPDPDGDPVGYRLYVGTAAAGLPMVQDSGTTTYQLLSAGFGTTYYWQVSAYDSYGATSTTPVQTLVLNLQNSPPSSFAVISGSGTLSTRATSQTLFWQNAMDPDGDTVNYGVFLATSAATLPLARLSTTTSFTLDFQYGTTYYWRVEAYDGYGGTATITGGSQTFLPLFLNDPPAQVDLIAPFKGSPVIETMRNSVAVSWPQVTTPQGDPVTYTVYLGDSSDSQNVLVRISQTQSVAGLRLTATPAAVRPRSQVQQDGDSIRLTLTDLDYYKTYYFRVVASNPYGASSQTPLQTFTLGPANGFPKAYNYPNPFNPNRGATHIVFNAPPSGYARATVSIYSELQDLLSRREYSNIPPGVSQADFDGRDRYGRTFFNGSYICRVRFEGPDDEETFYIMVLK